MQLSQFCIKRPVFTIVMQCLIVLAGIVSYFSLPVREYPDITIPMVTIETEYTGANASIIESQITKVVEDAVFGIEGAEVVSSASEDEKSTVRVRFEVSRDIDDATNDIRDKVSRVRSLLPRDAEEPQITKVSDDNDAMMWLAGFAEDLDLLELSVFADTLMKDQLESVTGVAGVRVVGSRGKSMRIWLDNDKLAAYNVTVPEITAALAQQHIELPAGRLEGRFREFTILSKTKLYTPAGFGDIIIRDDGDYLLRIKDVAEVEIAPLTERFITRYKGQTGVGLGIIKQSTANPLKVANAIYERLPILNAQLPDGVDVYIAYDSTTAIRDSINAVYKAIFEAVLLVIFVIFLFLRRFHTTLVPIVTIPVSLIGVFAITSLFGYSINILTLLAMVLAIGLVVDDAIVVLENIHRHVEAGLSPLEAAKKGMREISSAVVAMTLSLVAVFLPLAFAPGRIGRLFSEFAVVLSGAVLISGFIALTLSPVMCSRWRSDATAKETGWSARIRDILDRLYDSYPHFLAYCLARRKLMGQLLLGVFLAVVVLFNVLPHELAPEEDRSFVIVVGEAPLGATLAYTDQYARQAEAIIGAQPETNAFFTLLGFPRPNQFVMFTRFVPLSARDRSTAEITQGLFPQFMQITGARVFAFAPPSSIEGRSGFEGSVNINLLSTRSYERLEEISQAVMAQARQAMPGLQNLKSDLDWTQPQLRIQVDRDKAARLGIDIRTLAETLQVMLGGRTLGKYEDGTEQYDVIMQLDKPFRYDLKDLRTIYMRTASGDIVSLDNVVQIEERRVAPELNHRNKMRSVNLTATLDESLTLGEALDYLAETAREVGGQDIVIDYGGTSRTLKQSENTMIFVFALALIVIYLVLSAQFESFFYPWTIMMTVPLGILGALLFLWLGGGSLNIYSQIGMVTLIGLITKHGILMVEFANQKKAAGLGYQQAIFEAASIRFRPILMTTAATMLGAFPLMFASGTGSEGRQEIGMTIVGGMGIGTLFTLFLIPIVYCWFQEARDWLASRRERPAQ